MSKRCLKQISKRVVKATGRAILAVDTTLNAVDQSEARMRVIDVFGDPAKAQTWLDRPNRALSGATPRSLLSTPEGCERVLRILGQIEHGVY